MRNNGQMRLSHSILAAVALTSQIAAAQGNGAPPDHQHDMQNMAGMHHATGHAADKDQAGMFLMNESSGTGLQPSAWRMPMLMTRAGSWHLMWMAQLFLVDTQQSGPRGGDKL